jgi:hypothetical protein
MDPRPTRRPGRPADHDRVDVRISEPGEIAAALPQLLGFRPRESVVLVSLAGRSGRRVGLTVRADIPPAGDAAAAAPVLARSVRTGRPSAVLVAVVSEVASPSDLPHRPLVGEVVRALDSVAVPVPEILLVRGGRWWSYDCPNPCCDPAAGTPLPAGVTQLEAAAVAAGTVVERDREALGARLAGPGRAAREGMADVCARVAADCTAAVAETGWDGFAAASWVAVTDALRRCRPGPPAGPLSDEEIARVVCGLRDAEVRDRALELALGADAPAAEQLWTECTRRAPAPLDAAPATLLAVSAWLRGDGAMANVALGRALDAEPGYGLAMLLSEALAACLPPEELRHLLEATTARLGSTFPAG